MDLAGMLLSVLILRRLTSPRTKRYIIAPIKIPIPEIIKANIKEPVAVTINPVTNGPKTPPALEKVFCKPHKTDALPTGAMSLTSDHTAQDAINRPI